MNNVLDYFMTSENYLKSNAMYINVLMLIQHVENSKKKTPEQWCEILKMLYYRTTEEYKLFCNPYTKEVITQYFIEMAKNNYINEGRYYYSGLILAFPISKIDFF